MAEYIENMKEIFAFMMIFLSHQIFGPIGFWSIFLIFFTWKTKDYTKLDKTTTKKKRPGSKIRKAKRKTKSEKQRFPIHSKRNLQKS